MTESVLLAIVDKLPYGWVVFFCCFLLTSRELKKGWNCLENLYKKYLAKELSREVKYHNIINDYNKITKENTEVLSKVIRILNKNEENK